MKVTQAIANDDAQAAGQWQSPSDSQPVASKFHTPRVGIVITHFNYAAFIGDALLSVQQQTYENFTCIVVDDHSDELEYNALKHSVASLGDDRFKLVRNTENLGQTPSFFRGLEEIGASVRRRA